LESLPIDEYKKICDVFNEDVYNAISLEQCTMERKAFGGPAPENVRAQAKRIKELLKNKD
jgi:argininosuccinate lyase